MNRRDFIRLLGAVPVVAAIPATSVAGGLLAGKSWAYNAVLEMATGVSGGMAAGVIERVATLDPAMIGSCWTDELQIVFMQTIMDAISESEDTSDEPITITVVRSEIGE